MGRLQMDTTLAVPGDGHRNSDEELRMIYTANGWSIDLKPGWSRAKPVSEQPGSHAIAFAPNSSNALLTITTFDPSVSRIGAKSWVELVARINRQKQRHVEPTRIGDFSGFYISFVAESVHIRAWALRFIGDPLDVTYRCDATAVGRYDADVDTMLSSVWRLMQSTE